jgi:uncharacterized protein YcfJ
MIMLVMATLVSAQARQVFLRKDTPVYKETRYGAIENLGTFLAGTEVVFFDRRTKVPGMGAGVLIKRIRRPNQIASNYRYNLAVDINRTSDFENFIMLERDLDMPRRVNPPRRETPRREVIIERRTERRVDYGREFQVCYETPRTRVVTRNEQQRKRGNRNVIGGAGAIIGGQILGAITGNDRLGDIISVVGAGFLAVGAVQVASSDEVFYTDYDYNCRSYYKPDPRVYTFRRGGNRCATTRYYSNRWGSEYEYFETRCGGSTYVSFERSYEIYAY